MALLVRTINQWLQFWYSFPLCLPEVRQIYAVLYPDVLSTPGNFLWILCYLHCINFYSIFLILSIVDNTEKNAELTQKQLFQKLDVEGIAQENHEYPLFNFFTQQNDIVSYMCYSSLLLVVTMAYIDFFPSLWALLLSSLFCPNKDVIILILLNLFYRLLLVILNSF